MSEFIDLKRRFRELRDEELGHGELEDTETLASLGEWGFGASIGWSELLEHPRVVLLAEAGAGKTREMSEQAKRLVEDGRHALFVPLESLDREPLTALLSPSDEKRLESWLADGSEPGWFFLDAVDELKLTDGKFDRALRRFSRDIDGHLDRARIVVSCRPSDWRSSLDLTTVRSRLPVPEGRGDMVAPTPEEVFMAALEHAPPGPVSFSQGQPGDPVRSAVRTVAMLPMNDGQIREFAKHCGVNDAGALLEEIAQEDAWDFARRPLDLADLVSSWRKAGRLGSREEQHEGNVTAKLRDHPGRGDSDALTDRDARIGAEALALGLALARARAIRSPERAADATTGEGVLDADAILPGLTEAQRQALLRRALFDPATYGRIRFHHRSVQEYLAACRLRRLRDKGMTRRALSRLLFAEVHGDKVVRSSMRAIAAWLALWERDVLGELIEREPEALLSLGDPSALELGARGRLLRAFVDVYGEGGWRGLDIPVEAVRRISHPELGDIVRECWELGASNVDVRNLLLEMIWQGPIEGCVDLARTAALDATCGPDCRINAIRALLGCGRDGTVREFASAMLVDAASWPDEVVCHVAADLFPRIISAEELLALMEMRHEPAGTAWGFNWISKHIAMSVDPWSQPAIALRKKLADLIFRTRDERLEPYRIRGTFSDLGPALATLCERQLADSAGEPDAGLIRACVIASRFGAGETDPDDSIGKLKARFETGASLRRAALWAEQAFMDEIDPKTDDLQRLYRAARDGLAGPLTEADRPWLAASLGDESRPERRPVALDALIDLWFVRGRVVSELDELRQLAKEDEDLLQLLAEQTAAPTEEMQSKLDAITREDERRQRDRAEDEEQRLEAWRTWRERLVVNLDEAFSVENEGGTLYTVYGWLRERKQDRSRFNCWDGGALVQALGPEATERVEAAFRALWRRQTPVLWSARSPEAKHSIRSDWVQGLVGVSAEASHAEWTKGLSSQEARTAAAYATIEMNGFARFIGNLAQSHPSEVEEVIGGEISAELALGSEHEHLPTLQSLGHADATLKRLLVPRLLAEIASWPNAFSEESGPKWLHHLERVLRVLRNAAREEDRGAITRECLTRFQADPGGPLAIMWLRGLFQHDPRRGAKALIGALGRVSAPEASERAVETFAALFGGRDPSVLEIPDPAERARLLGELVRCAYTCVRREDDVEHRGTYTPDTRDDAQTARNFLLSVLLDTPGAEARRVVLELAGEEDFAHFPDRLRLLVRQKAAEEAELAPFDTASIIALEDKLEAPSLDAQGLHAVMMDRLEELAHELRHNDFSDRRTVGGITEESEMQRTLAMRLETKANGVYKVTREEEVADAKRTDIRLLAVKGGKKAVIEVKIADKDRSLRQLEKALENQLVRRYLRHVDCKSGCLLLTFGGNRKGWRHPKSGKRLNFVGAVEYLRERARRIETETSHDVRVTVFGLDLADSAPKPDCCES